VVLKTIEDENLVNRARLKGEQIVAAFTEKLQGNPQVIDIRHKGLMIGIELAQPCPTLVSAALEQGLLINVTNEKVIRLLPPLVIKNKQIDFLVNTLSTLIHAQSQPM
jgi:acetylornithine aminotransferase